MREQLQQYVALLFAGAPDCEEIQQEILQNTLDRYDDLIAQGKVPEAAYRLAISSIGDINEILKAAPTAGTTAQAKVQKHSEMEPKKRNWLPIGIAGIVCLILLTVLLLILFGSIANRRYNITEVNLTANTVAAEDLSRTATLGKAATIYSSPSEDADVKGQLEAGTEITIQRQENVGNMLWAYIDAPIQGWMVLEDRNPKTDPDAVPYAAIEEVVTLPAKTQVYGAPSVEKGADNGALQAGTEVSITRRELINGQEWVFIIFPVNGWIPVANLEAASSTEPSDLVTVTEPIATVENTLPAVLDYEGIFIPEGDVAALTALSIDWIAGDIQILSGDDGRILIQETEGDQLLDWKIKNGKLSIDFCEESLMKSFRLGGAAAKNLTVTIPRNWVCRELEIDAASSDLVLQNVAAQQVEIDAVSGRTEFIDCDLSSLDVETTSGDIYFTGYLDVLECDSVSGNFIGTVNNSPRGIEMESASGSLDLTIPDGTGFTVRLDGIKNILAAQEFHLVKQNNAYIHGDGACKIELESASGGVYLQKAK